LITAPYETIQWLLESQPWVRYGTLVDLLAKPEDSSEVVSARGRFTAGSVWKAWSEWDFGQKKVPSVWITFLVLRIIRRMGENILVSNMNGL
jgi:hypothetical protein